MSKWWVNKERNWYGPYDSVRAEAEAKRLSVNAQTYVVFGEKGEEGTCQCGFYKGRRDSERPFPLDIPHDAGGHPR